MEKQRVRISLDVNKELADKIKSTANKQDITVNALIRIALQQYISKIEVAE